MASQAVIKAKYRKAACCGTCLYEKARYCSRLCMAVQENHVCASHKDDPARASRLVSCQKCAFGLSGDRTCKDGCDTSSKVKSCYSGKALQAK